MSKNILVIEDDDTQRDLMCQMIKHLGYQVVSTGTGREGLSKIPETSFDLVLIDIHLPDISGFQVMREILEMNKSHPRIMLMSVDTSEESAILGISSGADGYIGKPIRLNELAHKIAAIFQTEISGEKIKEISDGIRKEEPPEKTWSRDLLNYMLEDGGGRKNDYLVTFASILTVRINGLDELCDVLESDVFHKELRSLISDISRIVYKNRGSINHIVNETIICTFGTPVVYDLDTINAMICSAELMEFLESYENHIESFYKIKTHGLIGITSGRVYSGSLAGVRRLNHAILGQPVRRAQLMISMTPSRNNCTIIDEDTKNVLKDYIDYTEVESSPCLHGESLYELESIDYDKVYTLPNIKKQYTPKDSISDEGYEKL